MKKLLLGLVVSSTAIASGWLQSGSGGGGGGGGTVTSVGLALPSSLFNVSGSPVTTIGTLTGTFVTKNANTVFAGPVNGVAATPAFRLLDPADIPSLAYVTGVSVTAPLTTTGGLSPTLGIDLADTSTDGYLSSIDWNTFNNKQAAGNYLTALTGDGTATGPGSAALTLATVNSSPGTFGNGANVSTITVNGKGLVTASSDTAILIAESQVTNLVTDLAAKQAGPLTGDVTTTGAAATLATVNSNVGSFTNANITVNAKGLVTAASNGTGNPLTVAPTVRRYTSGSGTYELPYAFIVTSASANINATYTNNGVTFTVRQSISGATLLYAAGVSAPAASGTLTKASGTGDATITFSQYLPTKYLRIRAVGGGGGGAGSAGASNNAGSGGTGVDSTFGANITASGGVGGATSAGSGLGGSGGSAISSAVVGLLAPGGSGTSYTASLAGARPAGGDGGNSILGGGGGGGAAAFTGVAGSTNTGGGGSGAGAPTAGFNGAGGGAGGGVDIIINTPALTYTYAVGAGGTAGTAGTGGSIGGAGAAGLVYVEEFYQ